MDEVAVALQVDAERGGVERPLDGLPMVGRLMQRAGLDDGHVHELARGEQIDDLRLGLCPRERIGPAIAAMRAGAQLEQRPGASAGAARWPRPGSAARALATTR
ncbi:MAG: hypothetical protein KDC98_09020 [Planctomycetes bacterium]|nr:hypothetical protein [Planctomycetota bacterium]